MSDMPAQVVAMNDQPRSAAREPARGAEGVPVVSASEVTYSASGVDIVDRVSLTVSRGEFLAIVGPSGCGKTTFLNLVAGLGQPTGGTLLVDGMPPVPSPNRAMYAFARDALLPWRTAGQNVALPLEITKTPKPAIRARVSELLERVGLPGAEGRYRAELSQGMRQRVALARALAPKPDLLVMDEPFAALDAQTRVAMQRVLLDVLTAENTTVVFVTHDLGEAITLADRVALFSRRPCRLRELVKVPIEKPRDSADLRTDPRFHELYDRLWQVLREEVEGLRAGERRPS